MAPSKEPTHTGTAFGQADAATTKTLRGKHAHELDLGILAPARLHVRRLRYLRAQLKPSQRLGSYFVEEARM